MFKLKIFLYSQLQTTRTIIFLRHVKVQFNHKIQGFVASFRGDKKIAKKKWLEFDLIRPHGGTKVVVQ